MRLHIVLVAPEIAPNTGNIIRLAANVGAGLHLVEPLGFTLDDRLLKRGGLDYHELADVTVHSSFDECAHALHDGRFFTFSAGHGSRYDSITFVDNDVLVFGTERTGLTNEVASSVPEPQRLFIPMRPGNRSLNLANAVTAVVFEAWRQADFAGASPDGGATTSETPGAPPF